jgi:hypothetical protein
MALYVVTVDGVALVAATAKTLLEITSGAQDRVRIVEWWIDFDGATSTAVPVKVEAQRFSAAVTTATTLAALPLDVAEGAAACTVKHTTTTEGAGTPTAGSGWIKRVHPQGSFHYQAPLGRELVIPIGGAFWRIRATAAAGVNATFGVIFEE